MSKSSIIHASCKGKKGDFPYQDYVSVQEYPSYSFAIVADGLGSSKSSARGANMICSLLAERFNSVAGYLFDIKEEAEKEYPVSNGRLISEYILQQIMNMH